MNATSRRCRRPPAKEIGSHHMVGNDERGLTPITAGFSGKSWIGRTPSHGELAWFLCGCGSGLFRLRCRLACRAVGLQKLLDCLGCDGLRVKITLGKFAANVLQ